MNDNQREEKIDNFINKLSNFKSRNNVKNPWEGENQRDNLKKFLMQAKNPKYILIGEAPGRKGCLKCGVPFCDDYTLAELISEPSVEAKRSKETSAQRIYQAFKKGFVAWNVFPFQPCYSDGRNRTPTRNEIAEGEQYLLDFLDIFNDPDSKDTDSKIILLGKKAKFSSRLSIRTYLEILHPSPQADKQRSCRGMEGWLEYIRSIPELKQE